MSDGPPATGEWECMECGCIEAGVKTRKPEACPGCGAHSLALEFFSYAEEDDPADTETIHEAGAWSSERRIAGIDEHGVQPVRRSNQED